MINRSCRTNIEIKDIASVTWECNCKWSSKGASLQRYFTLASYYYHLRSNEYFIGYSNMLSVTPSTLLPSPLLSLPPRRPLAYCLARKLARATFSFHAGALDVRPPLMCLSSARYRSSPSLRLPKHLAMPSKLVCRGSLQPTSQLAAPPGRTSSLLWLRH